MRQPTILNSVEDGTRALLQRAQKTDLLTLEEEQDLARRWRDHKDQAAADKIVRAHIRLASKIAAKHRSYGLPMDDLISQAILGLVQALQTFDPDRGNRYSTFAQWWVKASVQEYVMKNWSMVKIGTTKGQKSLFYNLKRLRNLIGSSPSGRLSQSEAEEIATKLSLMPHEVFEMESRLAARDASLNAPVQLDDNDVEWQDILPDESNADPEARLIEHHHMLYRSGLLHRAMSSLNPRERDILEQRRLNDDPVTLDVLSEKYSVSKERIRQIEARALEKLTRSVKFLASQQNEDRLPQAA